MRVLCAAYALSLSSHSTPLPPLGHERLTPGEYECVARNAAGEARETLRLALDVDRAAASPRAMVRVRERELPDAGGELEFEPGRALECACVGVQPDYPVRTFIRSAIWSVPVLLCFALPPDSCDRMDASATSTRERRYGVDRSGRRFEIPDEGAPDYGYGYGDFAHGEDGAGDTYTQSDTTALDLTARKKSVRSNESLLRLQNLDASDEGKAFECVVRNGHDLNSSRVLTLRARRAGALPFLLEKQSISEMRHWLTVQCRSPSPSRQRCASCRRAANRCATGAA